MKFPRSSANRADNVVHKFCTQADISKALQHRRAKDKINVLKIINKTNHCLAVGGTIMNLHGHLLWNYLNSLRKIKSVVLISTSSRTGSTKKGGKYSRADDQARNLAILFSNKLGETMYSSIAPILGLQSFRQVQRVKSKINGEKYYLPGINQWAIEDIAKREVRPLQNGMDGTRVIQSFIGENIW